jgi:hypothetical protein
LVGKPSDALPPEVVAWTGNQSFKPSSDLLEKARLASANIMDENRSELAQLGVSPVTSIRNGGAISPSCQGGWSEVA